MTAPTLARPAHLCDRCHHAITTEPTDLGFGYSREPDTDLTPVVTPVPDGVEGISLTGRPSRRAA
jgi:hypothetical protein